MVNSFYDFFTSLPKMQSVKNFYVPGYTEVFEMYSNVRVLPGPSFLPNVPSPLHPFIDNVKIPCYVIPLHLNNNCYGFVFKGQKGIKCTPRFCTYPWLLPNMNCLKRDSYVVLVEGFKDSYTLMKAGINVIPMLTSTLSSEFFRIIKQLNIRVLFVPDNDKDSNITIKSLDSFSNKADKFGITWDWFQLENVKDLGDFFESSLRKEALLQTKRIISYLQSSHLI